MAATCTNTLYVTGPEHWCIAFVALAASDGPTLNLLETFIPAPAMAGTEPSATDLAWRLEYWGTREPDTNTIVVPPMLDDGPLELSFDTPVTPPLAGVRSISALFPELSFTLESTYDFMVGTDTVTYRAGRLVR